MRIFQLVLLGSPSRAEPSETFNNVLILDGNGQSPCLQAKKTTYSPVCS